MTTFAQNCKRRMKSVTEIIKEHGGTVKTSQLASRAEYKRILGAVKRGSVVRIHQGVYADALTLFNNMIDVESVIPNGIVCLYNAWAHHNLSTTVPPAFYIAIEAKRKVSTNGALPVRLCYWKKENLEFGIAKYTISGFTVRMTDMERSVCDAIKYRNRIGADICAEVLRNYLNKNDRNIGKLIDYAKKLRVEKTLKNYLEIALA